VIPTRVHNFGTYFVTTNTWERRALFRKEQMAKAFIETLLHYRRERKYLLHEFVLMPEHFHLIITPNEITLERAMQLVKGGSSHKIDKDLGSRMEIWQKGYTDHRIRDAGDYLTHRDYVLSNPVEAGFCASPQQYPYCSAAGFELDPIPQRLKPLATTAERHG
jgi:REP-associated tyrosine transposase